MTSRPSPQTDAAGNQYCWLVFSSIRRPTAAPDPTNGNKRKAQVYVAGVVVDGTGSITSYAPLYLWNQDPTLNNFLPDWSR